MDNTADRINYMATLILSTLALLFVVGDSLPKLDKPTLIDKCMFVTMSAEILLALSSVVVVHNYNNGREVSEPRAVSEPCERKKIKKITSSLRRLAPIRSSCGPP